MRIKIILEPQSGEVTLPAQYNYVIQSLIYRTFSEGFAQKIHDVGFKFEKRTFKLFTFSRILEKGEQQDDKLVFKKQISFYFSSPFLDIVEDIGKGAITSTNVSLFRQTLSISGIEVITPPKFGGSNLIKMLSPVTMHSTLKKPDGTKKAYYYKPNEKEFSKLIEENAKKKYALVKGENTKDLSLELKPVHFSVKENLCVIKFKQTPIEAYTGIFELSGSKELIGVTYDAGLGDRNPGGFGMWEIWKGGNLSNDRRKSGE
jgi:CRISPR-associated endoribonuclease Cas6